MSLRHRLTASRLGLARECLYWARPDAVQDHPSDTAASRLGSALHDAAHRHPEVDLDAIAETWRLTAGETDTLCELYDSWAAWWPGYVGDRIERREVPFAWDTETWTARELPSTGHRDYSACKPSEIPGTMDAMLLGRYMAGDEEIIDSLEVVDLKTGFDWISAKGHSQLAGLGLVVARSLGFESVKVTIARVRPEGVETNFVVLHGAELDRIAVDIESYLQRIPTALPQPGEHCAGCPAAGNCPDTRALAVAVRDVREDLRGLFLGELRSDAQAARLRAGLKQLEKFLSDQEGRLVDYAREHGGGFDLGNGTRAEWVPQSRRRIKDEPAVIARLEKRFGPERAAGLVKIKRTIPIGGVEKAAKEGAPRGKKEAAAEEIMAELESTGHVALSTYEGWRTA